MTAVATERQTSALALLTPKQLEGVAATIVSANKNMENETAVRITDEALKFLAGAAGATSGKGLFPSKVVDEGWHALILNTELYADLCSRLGKVIHHVPQVRAEKGWDRIVVKRTLEAIRAAGYEPDTRLWGKNTDKLIPVAAECMHAECTPEGGHPDVSPAPAVA
ncbi:hypothetical protein ACFYMW_12045 [Streptomyces sp. NPDC006692]|uniref:hypothetical protein n=1 Tax=Streptomyces sp. NPDC006692 TaxID=3364758 RepID=UPI0036893509